MKIRYNVLVFGVLLIAIPLLTGCGPREQKKGNGFFVKDSLIYKEGESKPFSGKEVAKVYDKTVEYDVVDGMKSGEFKILYADGTPQIIGHIVKNKNEGLWQYFYPDSSLESEGNFTNDSASGKWNWYYKNGKLKEECTFKDGKRNGRWIKYDSAGKIASLKIFKDGKEIKKQDAGMQEAGRK